MDLGLKAWILVVGAAIIIAVLAHGLWLARQRARDALRMDLDPIQPDSLDEDLLYRAELPNGGARVVRPAEAPVQEPQQQPLPNIDEPVPLLIDPVEEQGGGAPPTGPAIGAEPIRADRPAAARSERHRRPGRAPQAEQVATETPGEPEEIIAFNVLARGERGLPGSEVVRFVTEAGLSYGEMNIFHRLDGDHIEYSMANAVEPGTFDLASIDQTELRGLSFFLRLPGPRRPAQALEHMIELVRALADRFDAELLDGQRNVLTGQGMEHAREQVGAFERRRLIQRA